MSVAPMDPVELTQRLVRTPSVNPALEEGGAGEEAVARLAAGWLDDWGYQVDLTKLSADRYNVVARRRRSDGPTLLLNGHLDTVGIGGMKEPFSGSLEGRRLHGRGACDMKAGVACALSTAGRLAKEDFEGELIVALTADEEHASLGMQALVDSGLRADGAIVCEPTELQIMPAHKGFLWIDVQVDGRAAHGSMPEVGVDAIVHMGAVLTALKTEARRLAEERGHPLLGPGSIHAGTISGGTAPSIYPESCDLVVERRTLPDETLEQIMAEMEHVLETARTSLPELSAAASAGLYRAATEVPTDSPLALALGAACRDQGLPVEIAGMTAWVDACFLNLSGTPALCFGPGSIAQAHSEDEWVSVEQIEACERVLTSFARTFLRSGG
ncbi:MAG: ArgE/DapE family deacylase [Longimicrobiales bacterium]